MRSKSYNNPDNSNNSTSLSISARKSRTSDKNDNKSISHCPICEQNLQDKYLKIYNGHLIDAVSENIALIDETLCLVNGDEKGFVASDRRPTNQLTYFNVYCKNNHLCSFDSDLIKKGVHLYASGYVKPIYDNNPSHEGGVPCSDIGPIVEWFVTGFDNDETAVIVLSTALGEYYLMAPSDDYAKFMIPVKKKTFLSKTVIGYLMDEPLAEYKDLLNKFQNTPMPELLPIFKEEMLIDNAQFIYDQIISIDKYALPDVPLLINAPCISSLKNLGMINEFN